MPIFKGTYRGRGIYWHGPTIGYGDETNGGFSTLAEYRRAIDAADVEAHTARPVWQKYWDTLPADVRQRYRSDSRIWEHEHGAPGVAWDDFTRSRR